MQFNEFFTFLLWASPTAGEKCKESLLRKRPAQPAKPAETISNEGASPIPAGSIDALVRYCSPDRRPQLSRCPLRRPSFCFGRFLRIASSATGGAQLRNLFCQLPPLRPYPPQAGAEFRNPLLPHKSAVGRGLLPLHAAVQSLVEYTCYERCLEAIALRYICPLKQ
jgi:hypothetical protein